MKKLKLLFSMVSAVVVCLAYGNTAYADWSGEVVTSDGYKVKYTYNDEIVTGASVSSYSGSETELSLPTSVEAVAGSGALKGQTLTVNITTVGASAFQDTKTITSVKIPDGYTEIGKRAFAGCTSLKGVALPTTLLSIGSDCFRGCTSLTDLTVPATAISIEDRAFYSCTALTAVALPEGTVTLHEELFYDCKALTDVTLPKSLVTIEKGAFRGCISLTELELPEQVAALPENMFRDCLSLKTLKITGPVAVLTTGWGMFYGCAALEEVYLPEALTLIDKGVFSYAKNLKDIYYPGSVEDWQKIRIEEGNTTVETSLIHCKDDRIYHKIHDLESDYTVDKPATMEENGSKSYHCTRCSEVDGEVTIYAAKTVKLAQKALIYTGKAQKPEVIVKNSKGSDIAKENYTVSFSKKKTKDIGTYTAKITFKGEYAGEKVLTYQIIPKNIEIKSVKAGKKEFTVNWKAASQITGYELQYSLNAKFKKAETVAIDKQKTAKTTVSKLKGGKKYYVRLRSYKKVNGVKIYGNWSKTKTVTTKK